MRLKLKVVPGASRSEIVGWLGDRLKVRVAAPPEKGKANSMVESLVAEALQLPGGSVCVISGTTSQHKILEVHGVSAAQLAQKLGQPEGAV